MKPERLFVERHGFAPYIPSGEQCSPQLHVVVDWYAGAHSDSLRAAHCGGCVRPYGITSQMAIYRYKRLCRLISLSNNLFFSSDWARADLAFLRIGRAPTVIGYCRPWSHCHTPADPSGGGFASVATEATPVETCHRHVSKSRLSNPPPAFRQSKKRHSFRNVFSLWWKVVDSNHRSHRRQIYSLFPLATRETFHIQLPA